jgi:hypothetical protein
MLGNGQPEYLDGPPCHTMYVLHSRTWRKVIKQPTNIMTCFGKFWANIYYDSYEIMTNHEFYDQIRSYKFYKFSMKYARTKG